MKFLCASDAKFVLQCCRAHLQRLLYIAVVHTCFPDAIWDSVVEQ